MKLVESILTKNPCYLAGRKIKIKGIMLHSVGCPQPKASAFINSWNDAAFDRACVHGFIDGLDGTIYQTLPWEYRGWHCGSGSKGSGNDSYIGVEMCEPDCIRYTSGADFSCSDLGAAKCVAERTYQTAVTLFAMLCNKYNLDPAADGVIISHKEGHSRGIASNHGDPEHLWIQLGMDYTMDSFRKSVKLAMETDIPVERKGTQAAELFGLSHKKVMERIGLLFTENQKKSGILASVSMAQFILESGYGQSELAQKANNLFGMKCTLSGNSWTGSSWDGQTKYKTETKEQKEDGTEYTAVAEFRKYAYIEDSIADHSAYLLGAMNGSRKRYAGLAEEADYQKAVQIIKDGGYATDIHYVKKVCTLIEKYNLTQYDMKPEENSVAPVWYRVRRSWGDPASQKGAFQDFDNAKKCADSHKGYAVFDESGEMLYANKYDLPYLVQIKITDLNIRKGPGTNFDKTGKYTGVGIFTIVEEADGEGASGWGKLKSGIGWISLDYTERV